MISSVILPIRLIVVLLIDFGSSISCCKKPKKEDEGANEEMIPMNPQAENEADNDQIKLTLGTVYNDFDASLLNSFRSRRHKHFVNLLP